MAADDPTPGELRIMIANVVNLLGDIKKDMATKEFVEAKFDAFLDRLARLETDHKEWVRTSTEAHVELDRDSKARHAETEKDMEALELKLHARIDKVRAELTAKLQTIVDEQRADQKEIKSARNGRVTAWIGIGLAWLANLALWFIDRGAQP